MKVRLTSPMECSEPVPLTLVVEPMVDFPGVKVIFEILMTSSFGGAMTFCRELREAIMVLKYLEKTQSQ